MRVREKSATARILHGVGICKLEPQKMTKAVSTICYRKTTSSDMLNRSYANVGNAK